MTQLELLKYLFAVLEGAEIPYAVVGSFASGVWGEPRMTRDVDVVVQLDPRHVDALIALFPAPNYYVSRTAIEEAICFERPFNVIHPASANKIDFMVVGRNSWAMAQIARRRRIQFLPDLEGFVAAPDDVILGKLVYFQEGGSDKHLRDIAGILKRSSALVDRAYLEQAAHKLGVAEIWKDVESQAAS